MCLRAKQQATSHSVKILDMLLHGQQVMPPYGYICDVKVVQLLYYKEILSIYWMTLVGIDKQNLWA